jgi:thymidylate kinase
LESFIIFLNNSPNYILKYTNKKFDLKDTYESKGIAFQHKLFQAYQEIFSLKSNVLYLSGFDTDTNLEKVKEYMNLNNI